MLNQPNKAYHPKVAKAGTKRSRIKELALEDATNMHFP
jgi:hypothetical protein